MKLYQQMMIADGCPAILVTMTQAERNQLWHDHPPVNPGRFIDPKLDQDRAMREQQKRDRTVIRIKKLKASVEKNKSTPMSLKGLRWDTNYSKWVPDGSGTVTQEEVEMPKLIITPYDANGLTLARGRTSVNENADQEQIDAKVQHAFKRAGKAAVRVEVTRNGEIVSTKDIPENFTLPTEAAPAATEEQQPNEGATEEADDMAKKTRKTTKSKKANGEVRRTRATVTMEMLARKSGVSAEELVDAFKKEFGDGKLTTAKLAIHKVPKAAKKKTIKEKSETRGTVYYLA